VKTLMAQIVLGAALLAAASVFAQTAYTEGLIIIPDATYAGKPTGIDDNNQVVGVFTAPVGVHGFVLSQGVIAQIDQPGANHTESTGINSVKGIVGWAIVGGNYEGDLDGGRVFKPVKNGQDKFIAGINASGTFVGYGDRGAFINTNGVYTYFVPGPCASLEQDNVYVTGINVHGDIVGYCHTANGVQVGFARIGGVDQTITVFGSPTYPTGINDSLVIAGYFTPPGSVNSFHGFLYSAGIPTQWDFQLGGGSPYVSTQILGINNGGSLVGITYDSKQGVWFPFYAFAD
jgi:hypothetical protein